jgi:hypothetical protein
MAGPPPPRDAVEVAGMLPNPGSWHASDDCVKSGSGRLVRIAWLMALMMACAQRSGQAPAAAPPRSNQVVLYLDGAERQAETDEQRQEILRALEDLRTLDPAALKSRRYANYENEPARWTLAELLRKYFVPRELRSIEEETLYRDAQSPAAREVVSRQIRALREGRQVFPLP